MISEKIKSLREKSGLSQSEIAAQLHISRSSVSSWEMGLTVPSTAFIVQLSKLFNVSTDCLFGLENTATISVKGLDDEEIAILVELANKFRKNK